MKRKNDMHVLNWGKIVETDLKNQLPMGKNHMDNKGILFEDVIEKLLEAMFSDEKWRRTSKSHDGKRDFVYPAEEGKKEQKWAECKNYSNNLSHQKF